MHNVLFVFAHQDDEYFAAPWIQDELQIGNRVLCAYLTNGGSRTDPQRRDAESMAGLRTLGVTPDDINFIGSVHGMPDGELVRHLDEAHDLLEQWLSEYSPVERVYAPDYEGGHADHDAAHLIALRIAKRAGIEANAWGFAMYNACGHRRPIFRTLRLLRRPGTRCLRYSLTRGYGLAMFCWRYRSQRRTWLGLFPESFLRRMFVRRECVNRFDTQRVQGRPHSGPLLYEWMFGTNWSEFDEQSRDFRRRLVT
jgi:LmbE family N-acetylglucosaminyl deacetylase